MLAPIRRTILTFPIAVSLSIVAPVWSQQSDDKAPEQNQQSEQQREDNDERNRNDNDLNLDRNQQPSPRDINQQVGLGVKVVESDRGVRVSWVSPNSPAEAAGLQSGDEILSVNGEEIQSVQELTSMVQQKEPGTRIQIEFMRNGNQVTADADLKRRDTFKTQRFASSQYQQPDQYRQGQDGQNQHQEGQFEQRQQRQSQQGTQEIVARMNQLQQQIQQMCNEWQKLRYALNATQGSASYQGGQQLSSYDQESRTDHYGRQDNHNGEREDREQTESDDNESNNLNEI